MTIHNFGTFKEERKPLVLSCCHCGAQHFLVHSDSDVTKRYQCYECRLWTDFPEQGDIVKDMI